MSSISQSGVCAFCLFTWFLSIFFVFHKKDLVLLNLISRYMTLSNFWEAKKLWTSVKWIFDISDSLNVTQIAAVSKIDGVNIYFCVSLLSPVCVVYVFVCAWYQIKVLAKFMWYLSNLQCRLYKCRFVI